MKRKTIAEHMLDVLRDTDNPGVMWGDLNLLHDAANRAAMKSCHPIDKCKRVLDALERDAKSKHPHFTMIYHRVNLWNGPRLVRGFVVAAPNPPDTSTKKE